MLIDWFTVGAQIVNFLILIYLLKRFLYKPILRAMDERERKIAGRLRDAEEKKRQAEEEARELAGQRQELEDSRNRMMAAARKEIEQWREEELAKAGQEVERARQAWRDSLEREQNDFIRRMKTALSSQVFRVAAKALRELADERLEAALVAVFIGKIADVVRTDGELAHEMGKRLLVRSGFALGDRQQKDVRTAVAELFPGAEVVFEVAREVGYGILLVGNNRKIEWSLTRFMDEMEAETVRAMHPDGGEN